MTWKLMGTDRKSHQELLLILHRAQGILRVSVPVKNARCVRRDF